MNPNKLKFRRIESGSRVAAVEQITTDLASMSWSDLRKLASERGVYKVGMSRAQVEAACGA